MENIGIGRYIMERLIHISKFAIRDDIVENASQRERAAIIRSVLDRLPERNKEVIKRLFGIDADQTKATELAKQMGISRSRVWQLKKVGIKRLRVMLSYEYRDGAL